LRDSQNVVMLHSTIYFFALKKNPAWSSECGTSVHRVFKINQGQMQHCFYYPRSYLITEQVSGSMDYLITEQVSGCAWKETPVWLQRHYTSTEVNYSYFFKQFFYWCFSEVCFVT
jgi:hypothetical protein